MIRVRFGVECKLALGNGVTHQDQYSIIELKEEYLELENYFVDIIYLMLQNLPDKLSAKVLRQEIDRIINLFNKINQPPLKTIQGLWAELLLIEQSKLPSYLIRSWHINNTDRFDFNDGIDKLEVKSTSRNKRIHTFSSLQINPNTNTNLLIASVMVLQTGIGTDILELVSRIETRLDNPTDAIKLREIVATTLGKKIKSSESYFFDYQYSVDSLLFYDCSALPNIPQDVVPKEISNVHFDIDLSLIDQVNPKNISGALAHSL